MKTECINFDTVHPTESNNYSLFDEALEQDPQVFFHASAKRNLESIINNGFKSALDLGTGHLASVTYAKNSSSCLAHLGSDINEEITVYAVKFESLESPKIVVNMSDIFVYSSDLQPLILGYCEIPKGFKYG